MAEQLERTTCPPSLPPAMSTDSTEIAAGPSTQSSTEKLGKRPLPSIMLRKFLSGHPGLGLSPDLQLRAVYPKPCFFYGSLVDPLRLSKVLSLQDTPKFRAATLHGYRLMLWSPYPALVDGAQEVVSGFVYDFQSAERLQRYETKNYRTKSCEITFEDETWVIGKTFIWAGDTNHLKEGTFDLQAWQAAEYGGASLKQSE